MNKQFIIYCIWLALSGVLGAAAIAIFTFIVFALGDSIFVTGKGV